MSMSSYVAERCEFLVMDIIYVFSTAKPFSITPTSPGQKSALASCLSLHRVNLCMLLIVCMSDFGECGIRGHNVNSLVFSWWIRVCAFN